MMGPGFRPTSPTGAVSSSKKRARGPDECVRRITRAKLSPPTHGSSASERSISDESALVPTSVPEESTDASDLDQDSENELSESSDDTSSGSSSNGDSDDESLAETNGEHEDEDTVVNLIANRGKKPSMKLPKDPLASDLRAHLAQFLPQLAAANEELEAQRKAGTLQEKAIEIGDDEEVGQYIEMDLGLGVLEHKEPGAEDAPPDADSDTEDILGKLMGREAKKDGVGIQEVGHEDS